MDCKRVDQNQPDAYQAAQFEEVLDKELEYFKERGRLKRKSDRVSDDEATKGECGSAYAASIVAEANKARLTGLAFSGGGIRSATFNLGVLQALARFKLLDQFDYLSTVSGGGYIGSWFAAWTRRKDLDLNKAENKSRSGESKGCDAKASNGLEAVACELACSVGADEDGEPKAAMQPDPVPIWHLREYSNYLSPRQGFWSTDTWTLGVTYIRNLVLTFSLLLVTLITLVIGTRAIASLYFKAAHGQYEIAYVLTPVLFCLFIFCASLLSGIELCGRRSKNRNSPIVSNLAFVSTLLAAAVGALWLWLTIASSPGIFTFTLASLMPSNLSLALIEAIPDNVGLALTVAPITISSVAGWYIGRWYGKRKARQSETNSALEKSAKNGPGFWSGFWVLVGGPLLSTATLIALLALLGSWMKTWLPVDIEAWDPGLWHIVVWGTPLFVFIFSIVAVVFVGVAGGALGELEREWLGRFFAVLSKWTALITFLILLVVYSYGWVEWLGHYVGGLVNLGVGAAWGALSAAGAFLARNAMSGKSTGQGWLKKTVVAIAPFVFILGMLILTVWATDRGIHWVVTHFGFIAPVNGDPPGYWYLMANVDVATLLGMLAVTTVTMLLWSWRVGVNRFSLHSMYADRLIRAYLGASNLERNAHPFTGFDDSDNSIYMSDLAQKEHPYSGPYPIINAAINLVSSRRLAWQKRKAASFTFTPQFCGYEFCGENDEADGRRTSRVGGFVESGCYAGEKGQGLSLGKAMTISGAAASPNMGYQSSPALSFLMTTFNVRLGWWLPNTAIENPILMAKRGPAWGLLYLLTELSGMTSARSKYVYLSDGGHFENLGIYELVRRRCRIIIACDSEADPNMTFSGLGNAIEKCRTDLGVPIDIDVSQIKPDPVTGHSLWHCAVGCVRYSEADPGQPDGTLVYIKASLTGDEPQDVATYASGHASFPHQTTADQWFDETQFESYRTLGEHIVQKVLGTAVNVAGSVKLDKNERIERVILEVRKQWYPESSTRTHKPSDHDALLESILDTIRTDKNLAFLDGQLYPNLQKVADTCFHNTTFPTRQHSIPGSYEAFRAGFYFCKRLIQFMQRVFYDRQLDVEHGAPRNRGWMNLFRRWSWSRMLRFTWTMTAGTYGARFQSFCEHRLGLESGEPEISEKPLEISATLYPGRDQPRLEPGPQPGAGEGEAFEWKEAKNLFGLHYYETRLISEFIGAYVHHEDLKDFSQPFIFQIFPLKVATDDVIEEQADKDMELNAGFLIAGPALKKSGDGTQDFENAILYFRIRPSMRNMDLARKAFLECRKHKILQTCPIRLVDKLPSISAETKAAWERRAYRDVHSMSRENLDHCRWFSQLLEEVAENRGKQA